MSNIVPRRSIQVVQPDHLLNTHVANAERAGIAAVARLQAAGYAGSVAMQGATTLSRSADAAFRLSPMGEDTYRAILMAYGSVAVSEIQALSLQNRGQH
jgi:hypothetical protein